jgi:2-hydroxychromene-2-carboxylate isomerase
MTAQVEFFFDCSSPWTYLGFEALVKASTNRNELGWLNQGLAEARKGLQ